MSSGVARFCFHVRRQSRKCQVKTLHYVVDATTGGGGALRPSRPFSRRTIGHSAESQWNVMSVLMLPRGLFSTGGRSLQGVEVKAILL